MVFLNLCLKFVIDKTIQYNQLKLRSENNNIFVHPNQQEDHNNGINILVTRMQYSRINNTIYWMVTVMLWCSYVKPNHYKVSPPYFILVKNSMKKTGISKKFSCLCYRKDTTSQSTQNHIQEQQFIHEAKPKTRSKLQDQYLGT